MAGSGLTLAASVQARRERFGLSYLVAGEDNLPALAEIVGGL
jgi:hypothetical protein